MQNDGGRGGDITTAKLTSEEHMLDVDSTEISVDGRVEVMCKKTNANRLENEFQHRDVGVALTLSQCYGYLNRM